MTTDKRDNSAGMGHIYFDLRKYGKGDGEDNGHLSDQEVPTFLVSLGTGLGFTRQEFYPRHPTLQTGRLSACIPTDRLLQRAPEARTAGLQ